ncbi:MAG: SLC13 family permease [Chloroflexi bacterium]|nr:SLC13 family permease [Chloroflexota bacterium]MDA1271755.1 SLC13 family permease [Chloroflexota bacterium]
MIDLLTINNMRPSAIAFRIGLPLGVFLLVLLAPDPDGLTEQGQRALAVMALAVVLWATETLHIAVTGLVGIVMLVLVDAVDDVDGALYGFSQPVTYFLVGILTLGLGVHRSGLADRLAVYLIRFAGGSPKMLYVQMLAAFAGLTFALPSASTRGAIMVHVYEQVMEHWGVAKTAPLNKAVMIAMGGLNRLGSTALLAGGITPVVASALIAEFGGVDSFSWTSWFILMAVPFYLILIFGGLAVFLMYRSGFTLPEGATMVELTAGPIQPKEIKAGLIALGTALLWFTDFAHGLPPAVPALIAMTVILLPGIGLLTWREMETNMGWTNLFVIAASLSMANALIVSGAAQWFAETLVGSVDGFRDYPTLVLLAMSGAAAVVRVVMPNISGYLAFIIPVAMSTGAALGLNPVVCGLAVVVVGDSVVFYPASATGSVFIYQRAEIKASDVVRMGIIMTFIAIAVLFTIVLPYWSLVGENLTA